jgi:CubicO group peptidase (beta-lactamase class C family)
MRGARQVVAVFLLALATSLRGQLPSPAASPPVATELNRIAPRIDSYFRTFQHDFHVPGMVWGIVRDGRLVHLGTAGDQDLDSKRSITSDTLFRIASMSKAFTALAILKLRDEGKLALEAPAETYVPEMRGWTYPTSDSPRIRVRDLLNHVAGFVTDDPWGDRQTPMPEEQFTALLRAGVPFTRPPQSVFEYSNLGFAILGRIVTNVSGRPFADYIQQEIMRPLGMSSTGYDIFRSPEQRRALGYRWTDGRWVREPDMAHGAFGAMGGVQTSANDYARWVAFLLSAWPARDGPEQGPVRRSTVRELAQGSNFQIITQRPGINVAACAQATAYGLGMRIARDCDLGVTLAHGGGYPGYGSYVLLLPDYGVGFFAFANQTYSAPARPVWDAAMEMQRAGLLTRRPLPVSQALADAYAAAAAMYRAGNIAPGRTLLAMNFLMDRSAEGWRDELARLKGELGKCDTVSPPTATGALSGSFIWICTKGRLSGDLLLAPTNPPTIQALRFQRQP